MAHQDLLNDLAARRAAAELLGGEGRIERQRAAGKLTCRERVDLLFDAGTFTEIGGLVNHRPTSVTPTGEKVTPADGVVCGFGSIDGRPVGVVSEDFTTLGGSLGLNNMEKKRRMMKLAADDRLPLVWIFDGAGARTDEYIGEGLAPMDHFMALARLSGIAPQVGLVLGPSAGDSALLAGLMELVVMVRGNSMLAAGGPPLVLLGTGEEVTKEELGGSDVHCRISGLGDNQVESDEEAIALARRYLSYFPTNSYDYPPIAESTEDDPHRTDPSLRDVVPENVRRPYDMQRVVDSIVDAGSWFEIKPDYARMLITGLARMDGQPVGIIANQPKVSAGAITAAAGTKHRHFMDLCNAYHLPIVFLCDTPGVMTGPKSEREAALRIGMQVAHSFAFCESPIVTVITHKGFGYGGAAMGGLDAGQSAVLCWPTADFNAIPLESGIMAAYGRVIEASDEPDAMKAGLMEEFQALCGAMPAAEQFKVDDVIDPADTRPRIVEALNRGLARRHRPAAPVQRHGVLP